MNLEHLTTETPNEKSKNLDKLSSLEFCVLMNALDQSVAASVQKVLPQIAKAIDIIAERFKQGGRIVYIGAGTSGRLGLLDAVECVPTFGLKEGRVLGLIAGGQKAFIHAVEGAEDSPGLAAADLENIKLCDKDVLIGIAASGRTPYVLGGLEYANSIDAYTISISCNLNAEISKLAKLSIEVDTGSEILTGSTRLKAGTAQKLILNMISTGVMTQVGKVYKNLMVDVLCTNLKLTGRAARIVMLATGASLERAKEALRACANNAKVAIVMILNNVSAQQAKEILKKNEGFIESKK
ncbi:MAG: N-acetylmuramic acid 6-phosphate etherase [Elusimicrobiota bacterium]|jgi:N-acetylmuramic acid 6-phosphate etherase|nr:N-acetylmuramic acid 6-phosphate etherase [Elusimicrobiota bacterium]